MPRYKITMQYKGLYECEVTAEYEEQAIAFAKYDFSEDLSFGDMNMTTTCELIEEGEEE